jgi:hypothetical protein
MISRQAPHSVDIITDFLLKSSISDDNFINFFISSATKIIRNLVIITLH